jgi:hypothetical protein
VDISFIYENCTGMHVTVLGTFYVGTLPYWHSSGRCLNAINIKALVWYY